MPKKYPFTIRIIAIVTLIAFLSTQVAWGYDAQNSHLRSIQAKQAKGAGEEIAKAIGGEFIPVVAAEADAGGAKEKIVDTARKFFMPQRLEGVWGRYDTARILSALGMGFVMFAAVAYLENYIKGSVESINISKIGLTVFLWNLFIFIRTILSEWLPIKGKSQSAFSDWSVRRNMGWQKFSGQALHSAISLLIAFAPSFVLASFLTEGRGFPEIYKMIISGLTIGIPNGLYDAAMRRWLHFSWKVARWDFFRDMVMYFGACVVKAAVKFALGFEIIGLAYAVIAKTFGEGWAGWVESRDRRHEIELLSINQKYIRIADSSKNASRIIDYFVRTEGLQPGLATLKLGGDGVLGYNERDLQNKLDEIKGQKVNLIVDLDFFLVKPDTDISPTLAEINENIAGFFSKLTDCDISLGSLVIVNDPNADYSIQDKKGRPAPVEYFIDRIKDKVFITEGGTFSAVASDRVMPRCLIVYKTLFSPKYGNGRPKMILVDNVLENIPEETSHDVIIGEGFAKIGKIWFLHRDLPEDGIKVDEKDLQLQPEDIVIRLNGLYLRDGIFMQRKYSDSTVAMILTLQKLRNDLGPERFADFAFLDAGADNTAILGIVAAVLGAGQVISVENDSEYFALGEQGVTYTRSALENIQSQNLSNIKFERGDVTSRSFWKNRLGKIDAVMINMPEFGIPQVKRMSRYLTRVQYLILAGEPRYYFGNDTVIEADKILMRLMARTMRRAGSRMNLLVDYGEEYLGRPALVYKIAQSVAADAKGAGREPLADNANSTGLGFTAGEGKFTKVSGTFVKTATADAKGAGNAVFASGIAKKSVIMRSATSLGLAFAVILFAVFRELTRTYFLNDAGLLGKIDHRWLNDFLTVPGFTMILYVSLYTIYRSVYYLLQKILKVNVNVDFSRLNRAFKISLQLFALLFTAAVSYCEYMFKYHGVYNPEDILVYFVGGIFSIILAEFLSYPGDSLLKRQVSEQPQDGFPNASTGGTASADAKGAGREPLADNANSTGLGFTAGEGKFTKVSGTFVKTATADAKGAGSVGAITSFQDIRRLDTNYSFSSALARIFSNEQGLSEAVQRIRNADDQSLGVHVGFGSWFNLDIMAARKSAYGIIADRNDIQVEMYRALKESILDRRVVGQGLPIVQRRKKFAEVYSNRWAVNLADKPRRAMTRSMIIDELSRPGSWLASDEGFDHIQNMFRDQRIVYLRLDILDSDKFKSVADWIKSSGQRLDSVYVSNIWDWVSMNIVSPPFKVGEDPTDEELILNERRFVDSLDHLSAVSDSNTFFIESRGIKKGGFGDGLHVHVEPFDIGALRSRVDPTSTAADAKGAGEVEEFIALWRRQIAIIRQQAEEGEFANISVCVNEIVAGMGRIFADERFIDLKRYIKAELGATAVILDCSTQRASDYPVIVQSLASWEYCLAALERWQAQNKADAKGAGVKTLATGAELDKNDNLAVLTEKWGIHPSVAEKAISLGWTPGHWETIQSTASSLQAELRSVFSALPQVKIVMGLIGFGEGDIIAYHDKEGNPIICISANTDPEFITGQLIQLIPHELSHFVLADIYGIKLSASVSTDEGNARIRVVSKEAESMELSISIPALPQSYLPEQGEGYLSFDSLQIANSYMDVVCESLACRLMRLIGREKEYIEANVRGFALSNTSGFHTVLGELGQRAAIAASLQIMSEIAKNYYADKGLASSVLRQSRRFKPGILSPVRSKFLSLFEFYQWAGLKVVTDENIDDSSKNTGAFLAAADAKGAGVSARDAAIARAIGVARKRQMIHFAMAMKIFAICAEQTSRQQVRNEVEEVEEWL